MRCWADSLGDCKGPQSREHYLSRAIIGTGQVLVSGFPFLKGERKLIPGERLVAKVLCKHHNERLADLDAAAGDFFHVLRAFKHRAIELTNAGLKRGGFATYRVDGARTERWMLKTTITAAFGRHIAPMQRWQPPDLWVRCAFGQAAFPERCGFYMLSGDSTVNESDIAALGMRIVTRSENGNFTVVGGQFRIEELQFAIAMEPLHTSHTGYRTESLRDKPSLDTRQVISFDWTGLSAG